MNLNAPAVAELPAPTDLTRQRLADGVYAYVGEHGMPNAVTVQGGDGVLVIDSLFTPRHARRMLELLRETTDMPVVALVNTHFHGDHTLGNGEIPTSRIIAHRSVEEHLRTQGHAYLKLLCRVRADLAPEIADITFTHPSEFVDDAADLDLGGVRVELRYAGGHAHTRGDLTVALPDQRVCIAADLVFNGVLPVARDADLPGWIAALRALEADDRFAVLVPGHGPVGDPRLLARQRNVLERVTAAVTAARSRAAAREAALEEVGSLLHAEERIGQYVDLLLGPEVH
jgi:cyclase